MSARSCPFDCWKEQYRLSLGLLPLQPLTVTAPSLTIAENMADLIDGYCRLVNGATQSFIIRPQKGELLFLCERSRRAVREPRPDSP